MLGPLRRRLGRRLRRGFRALGPRRTRRWRLRLREWAGANVKAVLRSEKGEACFSATVTGYTSTCTNGGPTMFGSGAASLVNAALTTQNDHDHGTHTLGIAAGSDPGGVGFSGIARGASIIAIKGVSLPAGCSSGCATGFNWDDSIAALNYVYGLRNTYPIAAVNMSFGGGVYARSYCDSQLPSFLAIVQQLLSAGIAPVSIAGNDFSPSGLNAPACVTGVIAVGATSKSDTVPNYTNSSAELDLWAPGGDGGAPIQSSISGSAYGLQFGTSQAAPHVTGAFAILKQRSPHATVGKLLNDLQVTGMPITDSRNNVTKSRINIAQALTRYDSTPPSTPQNLSAIGTTAPTVQICWTNSTDNYGVDHYVVEKRASSSAAYSAIASTPSTCFSDSLVSPVYLYDYRVKAVDGSGNESGYSGNSYALTLSFTDDPSITGSVIRGVHISELRQAVDAWRTFAGLAHNWTSYAPLTGKIYFADVDSLVTALNAARTASGLSAFTFTSSPSPAVGVYGYAFHVQQLRNVMK